MYHSRFEPYKILRHYDRLQQLGRGNICDPVQWMVYPTNVCNLNCGHCIMRGERQGNEFLPKATMDKLVTDCVQKGIQSVVFAGGGEPLLNPHLLGTMHSMRQVGIEVGLNTNGLRMIPNMPVDYLRISVDAATRTTYAKVKGLDAWDRLNSNLDAVHGYKELGLAFLVRHDNGHEIEAFCQWAQKYPYKYLHIRPAYWPEHDEEIRKVMASEDVQRCADKYRDAYIRTDKFDGTWSDKPYSKCRATPLKAVLCADGRFAVCQDMFIKFGDYNNKSFDECWYSDEHRNAIASINLDTCPRCVEAPHNDIIENCVMSDGLKLGLI